jgi:hypothetical protein
MKIIGDEKSRDTFPLSEQKFNHFIFEMYVPKKV